MKKKNYSVFKTILNINKDVWKHDKLIYFHIFVYILVCTISPFLTIALPKISIGILENGGDSTIKNLVIGMGIFFIVAGLAGYLESKEDYILSARIIHDRFYLISHGLNKKMCMDYKYIEDAEFINKYEKAFEVLGSDDSGFEGTFKKVYEALPIFISTILMFILTATLNPFILLTLIIHTIASITVSYINQQYRYNRKEALSKASRKVDYLQKVTSDFSYGKDIRIYNLGNGIIGSLKKEIKGMVSIIKEMSRNKFALSFITVLTMLVSDVVMYGILINETLNGLSISSFTMYVALIASLQTYLMNLAEHISYINRESQYVSDFYNVMKDNLENTDGVNLTTDDTLEIVFDNVSFKYPGTENWILRNLNLTIKKSERLAIVGMNGAGKSTIVKLMTGLFYPTEGHIYINGTDITTINPKSLHNLFSAVFQDVNIFAVPIDENVACSETIDSERVNEALKKVNLYNKVQSFEKKEKTMMLKVIDENGTDFSGGERQKLSIARGLYKNAPMVIMDEPTAALDALAEAEIYESFSDMVKGKTAVYISHRLASTKFCDKIALFSKEGLLEYGTHDELLAKKGEYYNMFIIQGKYYQEDAV